MRSGWRVVLNGLHAKARALKNHSGFRRYAANTSWMMGEKILRMFVGLFVGIWVARYLGPENFGLLSYVQSLVFLFTVVAALGLDSIVVREIVRDESRKNELLGTAFGLKLIGALAIFPLLGFAVQFTSNDSTTNLLIFIVASATIFQSFNVIDFYYQAKVQSKYVALANSIALGSSSIIKVVLILNEAPLIAFAIMVTFDMMILVAGLAFFYLRRSMLSPLGWKFKWPLAKKLLSESWPLITAGVINSIYMKVDQVMLKEMVGATAVGVYSAATRLSEVWFGFGVVIVNSLFPAVVNAKTKSEKLYLERLGRLFIGMVIGAYFLIGLVAFLSDEIILLLYGEEFISAASVLVVHIASVLFVYLGVASGRWIIVEGLTKLNFYRNVLAMIANISLNLMLIPIVGVVGAAIASLAAYMIGFYFFDLLSREMRPIFYMKTKAFLFMS